MDPGVTRGNIVDPCGSPISQEERLGTTVNTCTKVDPGGSPLSLEVQNRTWWLPSVTRGKIVDLASSPLPLEVR